MKAIRFHPDADTEMMDAAVWYESQQSDLGKRFLASVQDALNRIEVNPELYAFVEGDVRRCLTRTFPFGVLFQIKPNFIAIIAEALAKPPADDTEVVPPFEKRTFFKDFWRVGLRPDRMKGRFCKSLSSDAPAS